MVKNREFKKHSLSVAMMLALISLSGCVSTSGSSSAGGSASATTPVVAEQGLTPRQRYRKALAYLENGKPRYAEAELREYLIAQPKSPSANDLLKQITSDSSEYYPSDNFEVTLRSGQSLSKLADRYLGSPLEFYALAKYNGIENPDNVVIGQKIKIPLTAHAKQLRRAKPVVAKAEVEPVVEVVEEIVPEVSQEGVADAAVEVASVAPEVEAEPVVETPDSIFSTLQQRLQQSDFTGAMATLETLKGMTEIGSEYRDAAVKTLTGFASSVEGEQPQLAAARLSEAAALQLASDERWMALTTLKKAVSLDQDNVSIAESLALLQKQMSDQYHREASSAFRRQELDVAITNWNRVLEIDPEHSSARVHLEQAKELKDRLAKFAKPQS